MPSCRKSLGLAGLYGSTVAGAARGLALWITAHQYLGPRHQPDQVLGHPPSYAFRRKATHS